MLTKEYLKKLDFKNETEVNNAIAMWNQMSFDDKYEIEEFFNIIGSYETRTKQETYCRDFMRTGSNPYVRVNVFKRIASRIGDVISNYVHNLQHRYLWWAKCAFWTWPLIIILLPVLTVIEILDTIHVNIWEKGRG